MDRFTAVTPYFPRRSAHIGIGLVGCGGTGSWLVEHLAGMSYDLQRFQITVDLILIDGDRVEEPNIGRQNFRPQDIGHNKAAVLAQRYSADYGVRIGHVPRMATSRLLQAIGHRLPAHGHNILIGAVDRFSGRRAIHQCFTRGRRWRPWHVAIDSGNDQTGGAIGWGTTARLDDLRGCFRTTGICVDLPLRTMVYPNLLHPGAPAPNQTCADAMLAGAQSLTINRAQAVHVLQVLYDLVYRHHILYWMCTLNYAGTRAVVTNTMISATTVAAMLWEDPNRARGLLQAPPRIRRSSQRIHHA